jgi:hypothetical protein
MSVWASTGLGKGSSDRVRLLGQRSLRHPRLGKGSSDSVRLLAQMFDFLSTQRTEKLLATKLDIGMVSGRRMRTAPHSVFPTWRRTTASTSLLQRAAAGVPYTAGVPDTAPCHSRSIASQGLPFNAIAGSSSHLPAQYGVQVSNGQDECDALMLIACSACRAYPVAS